MEVVAVDETREALEISEHKRKLWLVKVPTEVAEAWNSVTEDDVDLGTLTYYPPEATDNKRRKCTVQLKNQPDQAKPMPVKFLLNFKTPPPEMRVFSEAAQGDSVRVEGIVVENCTLQPQRTKAYRKTCKARLQASLQKDRFVQECDVVVGSTAVSFDTKLPNLGEQGDDGFGGEGRQKGSREKLDKEDLRAKILHFFQKKEYWKMKELNMHLNQPENHLKEALKEICIHHRKGDHKGTFGLKQEFKL